MYSSSSDDDARRVLLNAFNFDKYSWYSLLLFSTFVFSSICLSISIYSLFFSYSNLVAFFSKDFISSMRNCHILTIEDPIEYVYQQKQALIHQREVYEDVDSFDTALKSAMREDPDVILVGEMRDYETIQAVITLAETGHLVFSTLHTIGAPKTIDRIIDMFQDHQDQVRSQLSMILEATLVSN